MKTFEQYNYKEMEETFLELAHLDELEIQIDFNGYPNCIFYCYNNYRFFIQNKKSMTFFIKFQIYSHFNSRFNIKQIDKTFFNKMLKKYFNITGYNPSQL